MKKYVDLVLCSLPFEPAWYHARGFPNAVYVGHPYFDELKDRPLDADFLADQRSRSGELVAILPGSRTQEVLRNLPEMVRAANKLAFQRPGVRFGVACLHERHRKMAEGIVASVIEKEGRSPGLEIEIHAGQNPRADPAGPRGVGGLGVGRARADGRSASLGRPVQDQAIRPLGGELLHQVAVHQPRQSSG